MARKLSPKLEWINHEVERRFGGIGNVPDHKKGKVYRKLSKEYDQRFKR